MAATFVVEDGTGLSTANAYISVADADTYDENHNADSGWGAAAEAAQQKAIRLATQYLDATYGGRWRGMRYVETQALDWPRSSFEDYDGYATAYDEVPSAVEAACVELAIRVIAGDDLFPVDPNPGLKAKSFHNATTGQAETYVGSGINSKRKGYPIIDRLLADLIHQGGTVERG